MNTFWFDLETTGTDPEKNGIIQIAAAIERDGEIIDTFNDFQNPLTSKETKFIDSEALEINGHTIQSLAMFAPPSVCYNNLNSFLDKYGKRGIKAARYIPAGYNAGFDLDFLKQYFFEMSGGPFAFWDHLQFQAIDPYPVIVWLWRQNLLKIPNCKLSTVAGYFGIKINAHEALSDVLAARSISLVLKKEYFKC